MRVSKALCVACGHKIDAAAKLCPYCGADPKTGAKVDTQALLQETFHLNPSKTRFSIIEFARQRQGIVIALGVIVVLAILAGLHQFVTARNATAVSTGPAVPLSEITDLGGQPNDAAQLPMPSLTFQYDGNPAAMRTFIVESGAVTPPDVVAAQQAAAQAAQQAAAQTAQNGARTAAPPPNATPRPNGAAPAPAPPPSQPH
jgi:zinc-ribbon domain